MERCCICDYSPQEGSALLDRAPDRAVQVKWFPRFDGFYCTSCVTAIVDNANDIAHQELEEGEVEHEVIALNE